MLKLLIVEDEELIRTGLVYSINWLEYGCGVAAEAANGEAGLQAIIKYEPDIVITDIKMPICDGLEMLEKASSLGLSFTALILTSYGEFEYAQRAIKLGVADYILKPIDEEKLIASVLAAKTELERKREKSQRALPLSGEILPRPGGSRCVEKATELIRFHYSEKLGIEAAAAASEVSASYLSRRLREETGHSFLELLNGYRVQQAVRLLADTDSLVCEVADKTGFTDYKYFCSVFRKYTGMAPTEFAKKWK